MRLQFGEGLVDKGYAFIGLILEGFENIGIEDEDGQDGTGLGQGLVEAVVIMQPEVATEPEEGEFRFGHSFSQEES